MSMYYLRIIVWLLLTLLLSGTINNVQSAPAAFIPELAPSPAPVAFEPTAPVLPAFEISKPNCRSTCGSLVVPYPFGTTKGCYLENMSDSFLINCTDDTPYLGNGNLQVLNISLEGHIHVLAPVSNACYNTSGMVTGGLLYSLGLSKFSINSTRNKFTVIGCSTLALITGYRVQNYTTGCASVCDGVESVENGSCSGIGCCQTSLPKGARDFDVDFRTFNTSVLEKVPCSSAFVVEDGAYNFSSSHLNALEKTSFPVMLDWAVGNETCEIARKNETSYACATPGSTCSESIYEGTGYQCNCPSGYEGNPYLSNGCIGMCDTCSSQVVGLLICLSFL